MRVAIGCDELGFSYKIIIRKLLDEQGHEVVDFGVLENERTDYPDTASRLSYSIAAGKQDRGILICGTGIGMAMAANKVHGIRAAVCHDLYSTQRSILSNNAQILCMGALVIGPATARELVSVWMGLEFQECASSRKIAKIMEIENS